MSAKRIVIVSHYYPPHIGGIEIVAYNEATRLAARGHNVTVITSKTPGDPPSGWYEGVHVIRIPAFNGLEKKGIPFPLFSPSLLVRLWPAVRRADVVHIHDVFYISSFCSAVVAKLLRRPVVVTQHVAIVSHPSKLTTALEQFVYTTTGTWILGTSKQIITINGRIKDFLIGLGVSPGKLIDVHNGVDTEVFHRPDPEQRAASRATYGLSADAFVVLFIGRFVAKKGFSLMRAAESKEYLSAFAGGTTTLTPTANQRFLGRLTQAQLAELYRAADLFVLPSDSEGFPLTVQEAMVSGVPVMLKYDSGYERYKLQPAQVSYFNDVTADELRRMILTMQHDKTRRESMAEAAYEYAQRHFTWKHHIASLEKVYTDLSRRKREEIAV